MKTLVFDIETYKELFVFCARKYDNGTETTRYMFRSNNKMVSRKTIEQIHEVLAQPEVYLISYNGKKFDLPVLAKMYRDRTRYEAIPTKYIYQDAQSIISYDKFNNPMVRKHCVVREWSVKHFDMLNNCLLAKSLKQWEMYNGMDIREMPFPSNQEDLTEEQCQAVIEYCHYDVFALNRLFWQYGSLISASNEYVVSGSQLSTLQSYIELFARLKPEFQTSFDRTPASLSALLVYGTNQTIPPPMLDPLRLFDLKAFNVPIDVKIIIAKLARNESLAEAEYGGIVYGKGGAHFARPGFHQDIYEFDVASEYPSIIVNWGLLKTREALENFKAIRTERLGIKHDKAKATLNQALKLIMNSISGAFRIRSSYSVAFDPAAGEAMCYIGQLIISELAFAAEHDDLIEVNTDSVFVKGETAAQKLRVRAKELTAKYNMDFEEEHCDAMYFRDVNNYITYKKTETGFEFLKGKGTAYSDFKKKNSMTAVHKILFKVLTLSKEEYQNFKLPWNDFAWTEYIVKYHKSAASKYASIGGKPMTHKNYYFMWTTKECPDAQPIAFSRDLIDRHNGSVKARFGVFGFSLADFQRYAQYLDYSQYHRELDDELELWGREELCSTRIPKIQRKTLKDIALF